MLGLTTADGTTVVSYSYDPYGKLLSTTGSKADILGLYNPLRYRGYVYDQETSLYYLQSRYYDPQTARFLNADTFASTGQGILGNNMFAYCLNNPISCVDSMGSACNLIFSDCFDTLKSPWQDPTSAGGRTGSRIYYTPKYGKDQKEQQVLNTLKNQDISYYNGALVVDFSDSFLSSFSIGNVIFLKSSQHGIDTLRHEYGHIQQQREYGIMKYLFLVFIPSATYNLISRDNSTLASCYYSMPWEYDADMRSNIQRAEHKSWAKKARAIYFGLLG